jgi:hypothetical protein
MSLYSLTWGYWIWEGGLQLLSSDGIIGIIKFVRIFILVPKC